MIRWLVVLTYVSFMFFYAGREEASSQFTRNLLAKYFPALTPAQLGQWVVVVRKTGHVLAYAVLTVIAYGTAARTRGIRRRPLLFGAVFALFIAILDEKYQVGLPNRTGSWQDVLIDGIGIVLASLVISAVMRKKKKDREVREDREDESF